ncbi:helix-turn-helix transcriptional regulator [Saccharothrix stipae]
MVDTSARLLRLLSLLQTRRDWSGAELAERLDVTTRTVRRDVERLRGLGYPVHATRGTAGYRLGAGASLPPLLLEDDEAVAVAVGLRTAAGGSVAGIEETSSRALAKLEQVLPARLRHRVGALHSATVRVGAGGPRVEPDVLVAIADACRRHESLRFDYRSPRGGATTRSVQPHGLVSFTRHWYLVAWDTDRDDWRSFRVDRLALRTPNGPRFTPREPPDGDVAAYLEHRLSSRAWPVRATVLLHEPADTVTERIWPGMGVVEPVDERTCLLHVGAETAVDLVWMITSVDVAFTLTDGPPALVDALRAHADRCLRAIGGP